MTGTLCEGATQRLRSIRKLLLVAHSFSARGFRYVGTEGFPEREGVACLSEESRLRLKGAVLKDLALAYSRAAGLGEAMIPELDEFAPTDAADGWAGLHDDLNEGLSCIAATRGQKR